MTPPAWPPASLGRERIQPVEPCVGADIDASQRGEAIGQARVDGDSALCADRKFDLVGVGELHRHCELALRNLGLLILEIGKRAARQVCPEPLPCQIACTLPCQIWPGYRSSAALTASPGFTYFKFSWKNVARR